MGRGRRLASETQHESRKISVERGKFVQWRNHANVPVWTHDDQRTSSATDTISFVDPTTMGASNICVVEKNPIM